MEVLSARVTGFDKGATTYYTTEVSLGDLAWMVRIRYSSFLSFYTKLKQVEKDFEFNFPTKGGLFWSSPSAKERLPLLDDFVQKVVEHFKQRQYPEPMFQLLDKLFFISGTVPDKQDQEYLVEASGATESTTPSHEDFGAETDASVPTIDEEGESDMEDVQTREDASTSLSGDEEGSEAVKPLDAETMLAAARERNGFAQDQPESEDSVKRTTSKKDSGSDDLAAEETRGYEAPVKTFISKATKSVSTLRCRLLVSHCGQFESHTALNGDHCTPLDGSEVPLRKHLVHTFRGLRLYPFRFSILLVTMFVVTYAWSSKGPFIRAE